MRKYLHRNARYVPALLSLALGEVSILLGAAILVAALAG